MKATQNFAENSLAFMEATVMANPFIPHVPTPRQALFLAATEIEAFYGGAAGGGKSDALLMAALQFVDVPGYAALLLRKTFADLNQPNALIPRSFAWLGDSEARWRGSDHQWMFPTGAILKFGYLDTPLDIYQYQSSEFQFIGFDELTQFRERDYRYLFSRLRRLKGVSIPLRMRSGSNPGGIGHEWVKRRMLVEGKQNNRVFIPARLNDNPHLDRESYLQSLSHLDPVTRAQLERGDWTARQAGGLFQRENFIIKPVAPMTKIARWVRFWDLAATREGDAHDPDFTAGALLTLFEGQWWLRDVRHFRGAPKDVEDEIKRVAHSDPKGTEIIMEQEPGAAGKSLPDYYARTVLPGFTFHRALPVKRGRSLDFAWAGPFSSAVANHNFILVDGLWINDFLDEVEALPAGHDDQAVAVASAMLAFAGATAGAYSRVELPQDRERMPEGFRKSRDLW